MTTKLTTTLLVLLPKSASTKTLTRLFEAFATKKRVLKLGGAGPITPRRDEENEQPESGLIIQQSVEMRTAYEEHNEENDDEGDNDDNDDNDDGRNPPRRQRRHKWFFSSRNCVH